MSTSQQALYIYRNSLHYEIKVSFFANLAIFLVNIRLYEVTKNMLKLVIKPIYSGTIIITM